MSYVALYRAYRPQYFREVVGQKHIVLTLQNALKLNKVAHAYLFSGPRGTGKTTLAKIMAKALNCEDGIVTEPCGKCDLCRGITEGKISDVIEIDAASNNGVDEIREIRDKVKFLPSSGRYKVYIIDEVHMLSNGAFNALLKTLEEPPHHVIFILATTEPHKIPATILSRCQRFDFQGISSEDIHSKLKEVALSENLKVEDAALETISEVCDGGMRDALSLLDQSISYSSDDLISLSDVLAVSGNVSNELIIDLISSCKNNNQEEILGYVTKLVNDGKEIHKIVSDIITFLRDILLFKVGFGEKIIFKNPKFISLCNEINNQIVYEWLNNLNDVQNNIKFTNQKRTYLELGLLKMSDKKLNDYNSLTQRIEKLEKELIYLRDMKPEIKKEEVEKYPVDNEIIIEEAIGQESLDLVYEEIVLDDTFVTTKDVEKILNSGKKEYKEKVQKIIDNYKEKNPNNLILHIFGKGFVAAVSDKEALIVLDDEARCNRLIKKENYDKFINIINKGEKLIDNFICITNDNWNEIYLDYLSQFKQNISKPILKEIKMMVKKVDNNYKEKVDEVIEQAYNLFGKDIVKIKEN